MTTIVAIDAGYGWIKAMSYTLHAGQEKQRTTIFPATATPVPSVPQRVRMAGASMNIPAVVSFNAGKEIAHYRVAERTDPHVLLPESRIEFTPPVLAMLLYSLHRLAVRDASLVIVGVPIGYKIENAKILPPKWPKEYSVLGKTFRLQVRETIVTGQTVGTIARYEITQGVVVDVGYGTTDLVLVLNGKIVDALSIPVGVSDAVALAARHEQNPESAIQTNPQYIQSVCGKIQEAITLVIRRAGTQDSLPVYLTGGGGAVVAKANALAKYTLVENALWANAQGLLKVALATAKRKGLIP